MFRGNSSLGREQIRRNIANFMGEVGRVAQAAVSRKRPKQREKWVPKPKGPRRGSGRTRSAAREEAVRPLLQIVELLQTRGDLLEPWTLSAYVAQWNRTCRDAAVVWRTEATEMKLVGMPWQGDIQAYRIAIGPCLSFDVFHYLARTCQQLRVLELDLAEEPEDGDDSALVDLVRRCPLRRIWIRRCPHPSKALLEAFVYIADTLQELHFPMYVGEEGATLQPIARWCTNLQVLDIGNQCSGADDAVIKALARNPCPLRALNIDRTEVQDAAAAACITAHRETLESFVVFGSGECARTLRALARCPKLRHLDFEGWAFEHGGNRFIDDAGARAVVESCRNLTDFLLGNDCPKITDMPGLLDVLRENSRGGLEHLSLPVEADPATKAALVRLVAASPRLHTLKMEACCGGLRELLQHTPRLKELESSHVWQNEDEEARVLSDDDVRAVYECCPLLEKLDICHGDAEAVETDTWAALFDNHKHLGHVQMPRAENINHVVLAAIGRCKSLRCLYLQEFDCCDYGCARLAEESRLQELQLSPGPDGSDGGCTDQGVAFLCKIKSLRTLDFQSRPEEAPPLTDRTCDWVARNKTLWRVQFPHGANISREACERLWAARPRLIFEHFEGADGYMIPLMFPEGHPGNEPIPWESLSGSEGPGSESEGLDGDD